MTKQPLSVTEMFSSIMELLEQAGYAKHTLWGNMYGSIRSEEHTSELQTLTGISV